LWSVIQIASRQATIAIPTMLAGVLSSLPHGDRHE
jgi:hypothetical protein